MAQQIPYGLATSLINTLASLASREIASIYGVKNEIEKLKRTVDGIKAVLADADRKQQTDERIEFWIKELKEVLYEADDLFDDIHTQHLLRQRDSKGKRKSKVNVRYFLSRSKAIFFRHKVAREIRNIREKFNYVAETKSKLGLDRSLVVETKHENSSNWRETSSLVLQKEIVGREGSKKHIIDFLLNHNSNQNVSLVAIVGVGGVGKTALAQLVYNDADVESFFDKRMWVCVSQDFDVKPLLEKMLESLLEKKTEGNQSLELLQITLQQNLGGKKFVLVLDDIWDDFPSKWEDLRKFLLCGAEGSKILLTTRNRWVANDIGVKTPCLLEGLNNDESWALLKRLACDEDQKMTPNLEDIGRKIAGKCAGVPLAIRAIGSLLRSKSRESDWEAILKEGEFWNLRQDPNSIMRILKLSYDSLAIELKQCFTYCSLYPKDWRYEKDELIDLWMAQGFLENEDVGEAYVHTLLMKSFLQDVETDEFGEIEYFKMHDLMHDLSQSIGSTAHYVYGGGRKNVAERCPLHASFEEYNYDSSLNMTDLGHRLRTFLEIRGKHERNPSDLFVFRRLRGLDLSCYETRDLPESIGKMSHLRYLNLSYCSELIRLPRSISNLINLQTLKLKRCFRLKFSGDIITKLINLRRLDIGECKAFEDGMPIGLGRMTSLRSLSHFVVGKDRKKARLNELKELNLRGSLVIENLDLVRDVEEESKDVNLRTKKNIISLTLEWGPYSEMKDSDAMRLLENLRPHPNLKALTITGYPGVCLSDRLLSCTNLVELEFSFIENCHYLAVLDGLVSLKTLIIGWMPKLEYIYCKGCSSSPDFFPSLEELRIRGCGSLRGWQREANGQNTRDNECHHSLPPFSRLSYLDIDRCPNLSCMPTFPNLVTHLNLCDSSTKPLLDTLNVTAIGPSTSNNVAPSLSKLKYLFLDGIDIEALPEEWMQNLSSLKRLSIADFSSMVKLSSHMQNLSATLEEFSIHHYREKDCNVQWQDLRCLHSLQRIEFYLCDQLVALPEWICDLHSLRDIVIGYCEKLESLPERMRDLTNLQTLEVIKIPLLEGRCQRERGAEWHKIAHIPNIAINRRLI